MTGETRFGKSAKRTYGHLGVSTGHLQVHRWCKPGPAIVQMRLAAEDRGKFSGERDFPSHPPSAKGDPTANPVAVERA